MPHLAQTSVPILPGLAERWSPRAFETSPPLTQADLIPAFEAARWAPSANNNQPWRYIVGFKGDEVHDIISANLAGWNNAWMPLAPVLVATIAQTAFENGKPNAYALYDLGQSVAHFSIQAQSDGLYVHQVAGTNTTALQEAFNPPAGFEFFHTFAVGRLGNPDDLPEELAERERAPRERLPLDEIVRYSPF
jgi:nitroreductase